MELDVRRILDLPGEKLEFAGAVDLSWIQRLGASLFPESLAVGGQVENRAGVVLLRYQISGAMQYNCERCLMQTREPVRKAYGHTVVRALEDDSLDDVFLLAPEGRIDLDAVAASDLLLDLPQVLLCKPDCRGLCPKCGANRNETACGCSAEEGDPRMAILKQLLEKE